MNDTWHVDGELLKRYAAGALAEPAALSIETHLIGCAVCQAAAAPHVDPARLETVWHGVEDLIDAPRRGMVERLLERMGVAETTARLLAVTPTLLAPWLLSVALMLMMSALGGTSGSGKLGALVLLLVAPLVPVVGTASVFGRGGDVTSELTLAAPVAGLWLVLVRTTSVVLTSIAIAGGASLLVPNLGWEAFGWLIPALALTTLTLALASRLRPTVAAGIVGALWVMGVVGNEVVASGGLSGLRAGGPIEAVAFRSSGQLALLVVAVLAALVVVARRDSFELELEGLW